MVCLRRKGFGGGVIRASGHKWMAPLVWGEFTNGLSAWLAELRMQSEWEGQVKGTPAALVASDL